MILYADIARELTPAEVAAPSAESESKAPALRRLSTRHHRLARLLAEGMTPQQAGIACDLTPSRVSILQADPSFAELIMFYRMQVDAAFRDTAEKLSEIASLAAEEIIVRLEDEPEKMDISTLQQLLALSADRTGHAPQKQAPSVNLTMNIGERFEAARRRVTIDGHAKEIKDESQ